MKMDNVELEKVLTKDAHEDYVEYFIFPPEQQPEVNKDKSVQDILIEYTAAIQSLTRDYIWQKDSIVINKIDNLEDFDENEIIKKAI